MHFRFVWRALRRFGVTPDSLDDASQQVFATVALKLDAIEPGKERAYLIGIAYRVASNARRGRARRLEDPVADSDLSHHPDPDPEQLLDLKRRRALLDRALETLSEEQRAVFVLYELEGLSAPEIAQALELPAGTVASRLRRGRARFESAARDLRDKGAER